MIEKLEIKKPNFHPSLLHKARLEIGHGRHQQALKALEPEVDKNEQVMVKIERLRLKADALVGARTVKSLGEAKALCEAALTMVDDAPQKIKSLSEITLMCTLAEAMRLGNVNLQTETTELITAQIAGYSGPAKELLKYYSERTLGLNALPNEKLAIRHLTAAKVAMTAHNEAYGKNPSPMTTEISRDGLLEAACDSGVANLSISVVHQPGPALSTLLRLPLNP